MQRRARLPNNKFGEYISINVLETVCVVINFAASIYFCNIDGLDLDTFLVLLNWRNSTSACSWVDWKCKNSLIGRALGRLLRTAVVRTAVARTATATQHRVEYRGQQLTVAGGVERGKDGRIHTTINHSRRREERPGRPPCNNEPRSLLYITAAATQ